MCHSVFDLRKSPLWQCKHGCRKKKKEKRKKKKEINVLRKFDRGRRDV
jgi:hypothetical protein